MSLTLYFYSFRCDTKVDCQDKSDELNCTYITIGPDYSKELMPRNSKSKKPVKININISILALPYIDTQQLKFTVDFYLNLSWHDVRLGLKDLNTINLLNTLSQEDVANIWKPQLVFTNALGPYQTVYDDQVRVLRSQYIYITFERAWFAIQS